MGLCSLRLGPSSPPPRPTSRHRPWQSPLGSSLPRSSSCPPRSLSDTECARQNARSVGIGARLDPSDARSLGSSYNLYRGVLTSWRTVQGATMRYRRFGQSEIEVSEIGFGVWTLASDWWGRVDDKQGMLHAALDAGINFIDTAPVYGEGGIGETLLAEILKTQRDELVLTTKCGYDIDAERQWGGKQSERPQDWKPSAIRRQLEASLRRLGTDYIDLYQLHNARIDPILDDALWDELAKFRAEGKVRELGVALGPAIGWVDEGLEAVRRRPIVSLQTVFNVLQREPALAFAAEPNVSDGHVGRISRVPHASDAL